MSILSSILSTSKYIYTHSKQTRTDTQTHTTRQSYIYIATVTFFSSFARLLNPLLLLVETCNIRHYPPPNSNSTLMHIFLVPFLSFLFLAHFLSFAPPCYMTIVKDLYILNFIASTIPVVDDGYIYSSILFSFFLLLYGAQKKANLTTMIKHANRECRGLRVFSIRFLSPFTSGLLTFSRVAQHPCVRHCWCHWAYRKCTVAQWSRGHFWDFLSSWEMCTHDADEKSLWAMYSFVKKF